jgi:hypothetical protein
MPRGSSKVTNLLRLSPVEEKALACALEGLNARRSAGFLSIDQKAESKIMSDLAALLRQSAGKLQNAIGLVQASSERVSVYDENRMEKLSFVADVEPSMRMRDVRNRISHDYLPGQVRQIYEDIRTEFTPELARLSGRVEAHMGKLPPS